MAEEKRWITVAEAASKSGYSMRTIRRLLKEGKIEGWKPGHDWFTTLEAVIAYQQQVKRGRPKKEQSENNE